MGQLKKYGELGRKEKNGTTKPEALKSLYRSPGYKKKPIGPM